MSLSVTLKQDGKTAVGLAALNGHLPVLRLMVRKYGCSVEERDKVGQAYTDS